MSHPTFGIRKEARRRALHCFFPGRGFAKLSQLLPGPQRIWLSSNFSRTTNNSQKIIKSSPSSAAQFSTSSSSRLSTFLENYADVEMQDMSQKGGIQATWMGMEKVTVSYDQYQRQRKRQTQSQESRENRLSYPHPCHPLINSYIHQTPYVALMITNMFYPYSSPSFTGHVCLSSFKKRTSFDIEIWNKDGKIKHIHLRHT